MYRVGQGTSSDSLLSSVKQRQEGVFPQNDNLTVLTEDEDGTEMQLFSL